MCATLMPEPISFAIPKGRILDEALPLLARVGIEPAPDFFDSKSRSLIFGTNQPHISLIRVRAFDVATFVAHGAAQLGIVGSDVVDEFDYSELYAPVDLDIGHCRISVAEPAELAATDGYTTNQLITKLYDELLEYRGEIENFASFLRVSCLRYLTLRKGVGERPALSVVDKNAA